MEQLLFSESTEVSPGQKPKPKGFFGNIGDMIATGGAYATSEVGKTIGNLAKMTDYINPVSWAQKATEKITGKDVPTFGEMTQKGAEYIAEKPIELQKQLGTTESMGGKIGEVVGTTAGKIAGTLPVMAATSGLVGGATKAIASGTKAAAALETSPQLQHFSQTVLKLAENNPKIMAGIDFLTKSGASTAVTTATEKGELPSAKELALYGTVDLALLGLSSLGKGIYRSAFKGSKNVEKSLVKNFDKTVADTAEELGFVGSEQSIIEQAQKAKKGIWSQIVSEAQASKPVTRDQFENISLKIAEKMTKGLPDSVAKQEIEKTVKDTVMAYAPEVAAKGDEVVSIIKNINGALFGEGTKTVLSPKQMKSIESSLKSALKDVLPENIKPLYSDYARNSLIQDVMEDERVKQYILRGSIGAATAGGAEFSSEMAKGSGFASSVIKGVAAAIAGALLAETTANVGVATKVGSGLKKINNEITAQAIKKAIEYFNSSDQQQ